MMKKRLSILRSIAILTLLLTSTVAHADGKTPITINQVHGYVQAILAGNFSSLHCKWRSQTEDDVELWYYVANKLDQAKAGYLDNSGVSPVLVLLTPNDQGFWFADATEVQGVLRITFSDDQMSVKEIDVLSRTLVNENIGTMLNPNFQIVMNYGDTPLRCTQN